MCTFHRRPVLPQLGIRHCRFASVARSRACGITVRDSDTLGSQLRCECLPAATPNGGNGLQSNCSYLGQLRAPTVSASAPSVRHRGGLGHTVPGNCGRCIGGPLLTAGQASKRGMPSPPPTPLLSCATHVFVCVRGGRGGAYVGGTPAALSRGEGCSTGTPVESRTMSAVCAGVLAQSLRSTPPTCGVEVGGGGGATHVETSPAPLRRGGGQLCTFRRQTLVPRPSAHGPSATKRRYSARRRGCEELAPHSLIVTSSGVVGAGARPHHIPIHSAGHGPPRTCGGAMIYKYITCGVHRASSPSLLPHRAEGGGAAGVSLFIWVLDVKCVLVFALH